MAKEWVFGEGEGGWQDLDVRGMRTLKLVGGRFNNAHVCGRPPTRQSVEGGD